MAGRTLPAHDSALAHLAWTLSFDWAQCEAPPLRRRHGPIAWRQGTLADARAAMAGADPWQAVLQARRALGMGSMFRNGDAHCRGRRYGWRPGLGDRLARKIRRDVAQGLPDTVTAVRAYLDVIHVHPFEDGNARSAVLLADHLLGHGPAWEPILRLPKPVADDRVVRLMLQAMGMA